MPDPEPWQKPLSQSLDGEGPDPQLLFLGLPEAQLGREGKSPREFRDVGPRTVHPLSPFTILRGHCQPPTNIRGKHQWTMSRNNLSQAGLLPRAVGGRRHTCWGQTCCHLPPSQAPLRSPCLFCPRPLADHTLLDPTPWPYQFPRLPVCSSEAEDGLSGYRKDCCFPVFNP